jgi:spoIIIJ-associated protein
MSNQNAGSLDVSAKTVDEAIERGLAQLNLTREQVDIEIISEGRRGVFGLGAEEAHVRLTPRPQVAVESTQEVDASLTQAVESVTSLFEKVPAPASDLMDASAPSQALTGEQEKDVEIIAKRYLSDLLRLMGIRNAQITSGMATDLVEANEEPPLVLNVTGRDLGILIGRRSETLRALQYMLRLMVSKEMSSWQPIVVDVESYRVRRRRSLRRMAEKMAERAVNSRKRVVLEAMPAYERRLIHVALKDHPAVFTKSIGTDDNRKVTIIPR